MNKKQIGFLAAAMMGTLALGTSAFAEEGEATRLVSPSTTCPMRYGRSWWKRR